VERERRAIGLLNDALEQQLRKRIPESSLRALQVALDELLTNVIMHAEHATGPIEVAVRRGPEALATRISYLALAFDPTVWKPAKRSRTLAAARVGGSGIVLVRALIDDFTYAYADGLNVLTLRQRC